MVDLGGEGGAYERGTPVGSTVGGAGLSAECILESKRATGVPCSEEAAPFQDPPVGLFPRPYGDPGGMSVLYERFTPVVLFARRAVVRPRRGGGLS